MTPDSFTTAIPEPFQILGLKLKPLSIGRYRLLRRFNNSFVADTAADATLSDLLDGVVICSQRVDEFLAAFDTPAFHADLKRWGRQVAPVPPWGKLPLVGKWLLLLFPRLGKRWRRRHSFNFIEKAKLFQRYIDEAQHVPDYLVLHGGGGSNSSHWSHSIEVALRGELGWSREEIDEAPLSKALADYFKHMENQGLILIFTPVDLEEGRQNAEALEKFAADLERAAPKVQNPESRIQN